MHAKRLFDVNTSLSAELSPSNIPPTQVRITNTVPHPLEQFPILASAPDYHIIPRDTVRHHIETTGSPIHFKPRPLNPEKYKTAKEEFDKLLQLGIVRRSSSPWASPLHMVKKGDGTWRPCGDFRALNAITKPDRYATPNIEHFHNRLMGATIFSKLDLVKAYHFLPMAEDDIEKTAVCTPFGSFEYLRMPFGLRNSASSFQRFMDSILTGLPFVISYIDDLLIFSENPSQHEEHLKKVFERLESSGLRVNSKKCKFHQTSIEFLGFLVQASGIKPIPSKVANMRDLPPPRDQKTLRSQLGMFSFYQRFIPHFSSLVNPLRDVLRRNTFQWSSKEDEHFVTLKKALADAAELDYPREGATISITTDASSVAIGGCLHQTCNGNTTPLAFFSRKLSDTETRYSTFDRELLAIFAAIKK